MALIQPGPMASDIRGSMGGAVFSRNRSGLYIRRRVVPINPKTTGQTEARNRISALQLTFRTGLNPSQQQMWADLAAGTTAKNKIGLAISLTAQNVYIKINSLRLRCGLTAMHVAPAPPAGCDAPDVTLAGDTTSGVTLTACSPAMVADACFYIQVGAAVNQTVKSYGGPWPTTWGVNGAFTPPHTLVPAAQCAIGQRYHWRFRVVDANGRISNYITRQTDITV
jgi:hypothetical protein